MKEYFQFRQVFINPNEPERKWVETSFLFEREAPSETDAARDMAKRQMEHRRMGREPRIRRIVKADWFKPKQEERK